MKIGLLPVSMCYPAAIFTVKTGLLPVSMCYPAAIFTVKIGLLPVSMCYPAAIFTVKTGLLPLSICVILLQYSRRRLGYYLVQYVLSCCNIHCEDWVITCVHMCYPAAIFTKKIGVLPVSKCVILL